jgi:hypothetical protein
MLQIVIEQSSVDGVAAYLDRVKLRIFANMKLGMQEAMEGLAAEAVTQASAAGIQARTGALFRDILESPKVKETAELIVGRVSAESEMTSGGRKFRGYLGTALDEGFHVSVVEGKLFQFTPPGAETRFTRGHVAFDVAPHPFLSRAKQAFADPIMEIIAARVAEAYE